MTDAFFLPAVGGRRFCIFHPAQCAPPRGAIVYLHPFAEEMNKSRRMAAAQSREFAKAGYDVLQIDLYGCGDSDGDFGDATWESWIDDATAAQAWLRARGQGPIWFWGLRTGCLVATAASRRLEMPSDLLFWQPVLSGKQFLQQFLRLKVAGAMMSGDTKGIMEALKRQLAGNQAVEVAGYTLSPGLTAGLEQAELLAPPNPARSVWLEVSNRPEAQPTPAARSRAEEWKQAAWSLEHSVVAGPSFWQTVEIEHAPNLLTASVAALSEDRSVSSLPR